MTTEWLELIEASEFNTLQHWVLMRAEQLSPQGEHLAYYPPSLICWLMVICC